MSLVRYQLALLGERLNTGDLPLPCPGFERGANRSGEGIDVNLRLDLHHHTIGIHQQITGPAVQGQLNLVVRLATLDLAETP